MVGAVINGHKMAKHFALSITEDSFSYARRDDSIAREVRLDGLYIIRTSVPAAALSAEATVRAYKDLARVDIDQAWRLSRIMDCVISLRDRRRQSAPGRRRRADRPQLGDRGGVGRDQLRRAGAGFDRAAG